MAALDSYVRNWENDLRTLSKRVPVPYSNPRRTIITAPIVDPIVDPIIVDQEFAREFSETLTFWEIFDAIETHKKLSEVI